MADSLELSMERCREAAHAVDQAKQELEAIDLLNRAAVERALAAARELTAARAERIALTTQEGSKPCA